MTKPKIKSEYFSYYKLENNLIELRKNDKIVDEFFVYFDENNEDYIYFNREKLYLNQIEKL